ncbi:lamin tail domain-containing protein [bacterium]|nr:lamin tail domain-containing protein [bacterium]
MRKALVILAVVAIAGAAAAQDLIITEFMYKDDNDGGDWIELYNRGASPIVLDGLHMVDGDPGEPHDSHGHCALVGTLASGEVLVVVADFTDFGAVYPAVTNLNANAHDPADGDGFGLGGGGDTIFILDALDAVVFEMTYTDDPPWPPEPDGDGPSLLLARTDCADFSDAANWMVGEDGGSPGVLAGTVGNEDAAWGQIKRLYQ